MQALKRPMMSTEILTFDSALLSPMDQSFTDDCPQTQHSSEITALLASDQWLQDFDDIRQFCEGLELNLEYEPELSLEAMTKEVETQYQSKDDDIIDYLESTAFLSPVSIEPSSPHAGQDTGIDSETAISLLEEILVANSDNSLSSEQSFGAELTLSASDDAEVPQVADTPVATGGRPKRQTKRKAREIEASEIVEKPKAKKTKSTEAKRERKRSQNKCAANRYRQKKRAELNGIEETQNSFLESNAQLKAQLQKLQMEFKVVYPLAKAAFATDPNRSLQLQMLDIRVLNGELLE